MRFWPFFHPKERSSSPKQPSWERTSPPVAFDEQGRRHRTDVPYLLPKNEDFDAVINRLEDEWNTYQTHYAIYFACGQG